MSRAAAIFIALGLSLPNAARAAPAADFGIGAYACGKLLAAQQFDEQSLVADGWKPASQVSSIKVYSRSDVGVKLFLSSMFGSNTCVVDGYADKRDKVAELSSAIAKSLAPIAGSELKMPKSPMPNGQGFSYGSVMQILSTEKRPGGLSVRVTGMRIEP